MRSVKFIIAAGAASLMSTAVLAADMAIAPPPQMYAPPPVEDFGGWYLRGDVGMTNTKGKLFAPGYNDSTTLSYQQNNHEFTSGTSFGVGVGYQFNSWFRADITGEYRSKVNFSGNDFATVSASALPNYNGSNSYNIGDSYNGGYSSWVAMVNGYADLGTWWCVTPFVGAGVGAAYNRTSGLSDLGTFPQNFTSYPPGLGGPAYYSTTQTSLYQAGGADKLSLAWALHAGLAYKVSNNFTVELAYRYLNLGSAMTGSGSSFTGGTSARAFEYRDLTSQDVRLGVRWNLDSAPAYAPPPPPLIRKG